MSRSKSVCYIWTEKAAKYSGGKKKEGEVATYNGHPLTGGQIANAWQRRGWIKEAGHVGP